MSSSLTASARKMGSSSNRKMLASHARATNRASMPDRCPGANPGESTHQQSCGPVAKAALLQGADRGFESLQDYFSDAMPRYANGRAARLKPERLQVRVLLWVLMENDMAR